MTTRGIRGAITIESDTKNHILSATKELLDEILCVNPDLKSADITSAFFTVTDDVASVHPALAARQMGWDQVPMMCARENTGGRKFAVMYPCVDPLEYG